jgi:hypothetical protein
MQQISTALRSSTNNFPVEEYVATAYVWDSTKFQLCFSPFWVDSDVCLLHTVSAVSFSTQNLLKKIPPYSDGHYSHTTN